MTFFGPHVLLGIGLIGAPAEPVPHEGVVVIAPLEVDGDLTTLARTKLEAALRGGLSRSALRVEPSPPAIAECGDMECRRSVATEVEADYIVQPRVHVEDRFYELDVRLIAVATGEVVATSHESCSLCGAAEVEEVSLRQAAALAERLDTLELAPATMVLETTPAGAQVFVDGSAVGTTPATVELVPGTHTLVIEHPGRATIEQTIVAVRGVREHRTFTLAEVTSGNASARNLRIAGWSGIGVGAAMLSAGITFLAIDERPYRTQCSGVDVDADGDCRQRYDSLGHGIGLTAAGVIMAATGTALVIVGRQRERTPTLSLVMGPRTVGLAGRF